MKSAHTKLLVALVACLILPVAAQSDDGGWKLPNLNPFSRPAGPPTSKSMSGSGLKMPKLWNSGAKKPTAKPKGPSTWQKVTNGTKSVVSKTADALNPFDDANDKAKAEPTRITGSKSTFQQASTKKKSDPKAASSGSLWPTWLGGSPEPERPSTVNAFLNQPRVQP